MLDSSTAHSGSHNGTSAPGIHAARKSKVVPLDLTSYGTECAKRMRMAVSFMFSRGRDRSPRPIDELLRLARDDVLAEGLIHYDEHQPLLVAGPRVADVVAQIQAAVRARQELETAPGRDIASILSEGQDAIGEEVTEEEHAVPIEGDAEASGGAASSHIPPTAMAAMEGIPPGPSPPAGGDPALPATQLAASGALATQSGSIVPVEADTPKHRGEPRGDTTPSEQPSQRSMQLRQMSVTPRAATTGNDRLWRANTRTESIAWQRTVLPPTLLQPLAVAVLAALRRRHWEGFRGSRA